MADTLSSEKRRLIDQLLKKKGIEGQSSRLVQRKTTSDPCPLSFAQQRLWFLDQLGTGSAYNLPMAMGLAGRLNLEALKKSLHEIILRHEALRTTFATVDGSPVQVISENGSVDIPLIDLREMPHAEREAESMRMVEEEAQHPFDLSQGPLFRASLICLSEEEHILLLTMHHIVSDGWSMGIFTRELTALYDAFCRGEPSPLSDLPIQYADFAHWQRQWLQGEVLEKQLSYWRQLLEGVSVLQLPTDRPRPAVQTFHGACQTVELSPSLTAALNALSRREGVTLFMTLLAAFKILLSRYTGQEDIVVGSPIANRNRAEIEGLIGFFVNSLAMRSDLSGDPRFPEFLGRVREVALGAYTHQDLPFEKLVEELQPERDVSQSPLFQVMFGLQNAPMEALELSGLTLSLLRIESVTAVFDLELYLWEKPEGIRGLLLYNTDLFNETTIGRMLGHYQTLLEGIIADPDQRLSDLPLLTDAEQQQMLVEWNDTKTDYPADACIHTLFEARAEQNPESIAVVHEDRHLTYQELNCQANQLAHYLQKLGVGPETLVGICMERSIEMVAGILGILKAGGSYVPMDPAYPGERLKFMLDDAQVPVLLTQARLIQELPEHGSMVVCLDSDWKTVSRYSSDNPPGEVKAENLAYVIYTSGSTGKPRGVQIPHRSLVNHSVALMKKYALHPADRVLQFASLSFDVAAEELFPSWLSGATVVLQPDNVHLQIDTFFHFIEKEKLTVLNLPAPYWHEWVSELRRSRVQLPPALRIMIVGSDKVLPEQFTAWQKLYGDSVCLWNAYGPTEATITATLYESGSSSEKTEIYSVPIGFPIANTQVYVLDSRFQPVPSGIPGELYIGGDGLARNYLNRPELTAEKFIPNPFSAMPGARLYRTGDLVRSRSDGNIEFLGRMDTQAKIRGYRIEPGEIESVIGQHHAVREAVLLAREDVPGDKRLVAYVVTDQNIPLSGSDLRSFLKQKLPDYMVPSFFVFLDSIPVMPTGKVDRQALPAPKGEGSEARDRFIPPRTPLEKGMADIWRSVLGVDQVGIYDNFFDLGGHSLLLMRAIDRLEKQMALRIHPGDFMFQNLEQIATACSEQGQVPTEPKPAGEKMIKGEIEPFYFGMPEKPLYGCYQAHPSASLRNCGIVLCYPMGEEYIRFHRAYRQLAGHLSSAGFPVLRFDFYGCGDSGGDFEQGGTHQWSKDISSAIDEIRQRSGAEKICLAGLRLGATLAMTAGAARKDIDGMVLLDPVIQGRAYLDELVSWHQKMLRFSHVKESAQNSGRMPSEILGFPLTAEFVAELKNIDLFSVKEKPAQEVLVMESKRENYSRQLVEHLKHMDTKVHYKHTLMPELWARSDRFMIEDVSRVLMPYQILMSVVSWASEKFS